MGIIEIITLFGVMFALAAIPSTSVVLVVTRSLTVGTGNGVAVAGGIVLGDLVFVVLASIGLSVVAETMGGLFVIIRYLGAIYLLWLGFSLIMGKNEPGRSSSGVASKGSLLADFLAGFALTLGDVKAIFFYVSLLPMFVDMDKLGLPEILVIVLVTITSVGGVKIFYALSATRLADLTMGFRFRRIIRKTSGAVILGVGGYIMAKT
ncbi:MAG: LysE family translocator [Thiohalophilus sp.]|jgi:threonine/homoserine/homoserine lactone efflux protein